MKPEKYVFVCTNERPSGHPRGSCVQNGSIQVLQTFRDWSKALKKQGQRKVDAYQLRAMFGGLDALGRTPESDRAREASHAFVDRVLAE